MTSTVIIAGARTPIGKFKGGLAQFSAVDLGAIAAKTAIEKAQISVELIEYVIVGQVLTEGAGQLPARQTAIKAGIPWNVPTININKVCLSGINAIALADQLIRAGEYDTVLAIGQESMSTAPHIVPGARAGFGYGDVTLLDAVYYDGLRDVYTNGSMGVLTDVINQRYGFTREQQDEFAALSHQNAAKAWKDGIFSGEVVPVSIPQRKGEPIVITEDENIRADATAAALAKLKPAFVENGTITAGNASPLSDGGAAVIVMKKNKAEELGLSWLAEILAHGTFAGPDSSLQVQPAGALVNAARKIGITPQEIDIVEINEAFAAVGLASVQELKIDPAKVNIHGGAIAMGHPLGMSGTRITLHIAQQLRKRGGGVGAATLCGGGGQGDALILKG